MNWREEVEGDGDDADWKDWCEIHHGICYCSECDEIIVRFGDYCKHCYFNVKGPFHSTKCFYCSEICDECDVFMDCKNCKPEKAMLYKLVDEKHTKKLVYFDEPSSDTRDYYPLCKNCENNKINSFVHSSFVPKSSKHIKEQRKTPNITKILQKRQIIGKPYRYITHKDTLLVDCNESK